MIRYSRGRKRAEKMLPTGLSLKIAFGKDASRLFNEGCGIRMVSRSADEECILWNYLIVMR
jgi:hypothetical protein